MALSILNHPYFLTCAGIFFLGYGIGFLRGRVSPAHEISKLTNELEETKIKTRIEAEHVKQEIGRAHV